MRFKVKKAKSRILPKSKLILGGLSLSYVFCLVVLPIMGMIVILMKSDGSALWKQITQPQALYSLKMTLFFALFITLINVITGTATAWVLVRYHFPFKKVMNRLIDLPFAIPTVVTGIMLVTLYGPKSFMGRFFADQGIDIVFNKPGICLALLYVSYPFVVRTVQPVIIEMEREMEEAAKTLGASQFRIFFRLILPTLLPSILSGAALSFSRALGEFGSIVVVAGNIPMKTQMASVFVFGEIESGNPLGAVGVSFILLFSSFIIIIILNLIQRFRIKHAQ